MSGISPSCTLEWGRSMVTRFAILLRRWFRREKRCSEVALVAAPSNELAAHLLGCLYLDAESGATYRVTRVASAKNDVGISCLFGQLVCEWPPTPPTTADEPGLVRLRPVESE